MIARYSRPAMATVWSDESRYRRWLEVELAVLHAMHEEGTVPEADYRAVTDARIVLDPAKIDEIERTTRHDVIAFLTHVEEQVGDASRWIHLGLTSSDVLDTAYALQIRDASTIIDDGLGRLLAGLRELAMRHRMTPMIGRTHGIHAEPVTFGFVVAGWHAEIDRCRQRFAAAAEQMRFGKISGAVGTFASVPPSVERRALARLGLEAEPASTQVVPRDRHAHYFAAIALLGSSIERIAVNLRHLQRTEVLEAEEAFGRGQKGSSAMPHKKNPISAENIAGLCRLLRSNAVAAMENVPLWHERDISHSSVERVIGPDSTILADYLLDRLTRLVTGLGVHEANMRKNLELTGGLVHSQQVLIALARKGVRRQEAYVLVQRNAMAAWRGEGQFLELLLADTGVRAHLDEAELRACFALDHHFRHIDDIFGRVFGK